MTSANKIEELEAAMKTMAEAHHTALEVERAKVRELEAQLALAKMALSAKLHADRQEQLDRLQGWLSPDEAKALQAQCDNLEKDRTALEKHLEAVCKVIGHSPVSSAPPSETAQDLLDRLAKYEKQWNDMNFTICKLEQDLRKAKGEQ